VTYPNVLVLDYMQRTGQANPEVQMTAERYIGLGYQRLLTFETPGGGFSLFGDLPADTFLTAYGLLELSDMSRVYPVDEALLERTAWWLFQQQQPDGTWQVDDYRAGRGRLGATSYVAWALVQAGYGGDPRVKKAIDYIRQFALQEEDPYDIALAANALAAYDPRDVSTRAVLDRLYEMGRHEEGRTFWPAREASFMGATGASGSIETTALAVMAFLRADAYPDAVGDGLAYLVQSKDSWGTWSTTQATILSLKALLLASEKAGAVAEPATVRVSLNGEQVQEIAIDEHNADVVHLVTFDRGFRARDNRVEIEVQGGGNLMYQVTTRFYLPWELVPPRETGEPIAIDLAYDRTTLAVNDTVTVDATVRLNVPGVVRLALVDLGLPPGFSVLTEDLERLVEQGLIARYEVTGRQIIFYIEDLFEGKPLRFSYRLRARFPLRAQTLPSVAYDYYNPANRAVRSPLQITVSKAP